MSYTINKSDGTELVTINPNTINSDYGVTLVGRSYLDYGQMLNENLVRMLEHFANVTPPANPLEGQLWFDISDPDDKILRLRKGGQWVSLLDTSMEEVKIIAGPTLPSQGELAGDLFWNTDTKSIWVWTIDPDNISQNHWLQIYPPVPGTISRIQNAQNEPPSNIKFVDTNNEDYSGEIIIGVNSLTPRIRFTNDETIISNQFIFGTTEDFKVNSEGIYTKQQYFEMVDRGNVSGAFTWNLGTEQVAKIRLTGNSSMSSMVNRKNGAVYILMVQQDGVGNRTLSFPSSIFKFPDGTAPTLTTNANAIDIFTFVCINYFLYGQGLFNFTT